MTAATIADACDRAARFVHWNKPENQPFELDRLVIANEVGEWLCNATPWNWLLRPSVLRSIVAGQGWIDLPADFGRFVGIRMVRSAGYNIEMADQVAVDDARDMWSGASTYFKACILHAAPTTISVPVVRMEIGPVPTASVADVFRLSYAGTWLECTDENQPIPMPVWMHGLYIRCLALYLAGWERDGKGTVEARCLSVVGSALWQHAVDRDDTLQQDYGQSRNSAEDMIRGTTGDSFLSNQNPVPIVGP